MLLKVKSHEQYQEFLNAIYEDADKPSGKYIFEYPNKRRRVVLVNKDPSKTDPSWAAETEANNVIAKYMKTGQFPQANRVGSYADMTEIGDLHSAMEKVRAAQDAFMSLPSDLRLRFGNSPEAYLAFVQDKKNMDEALKLGLLIKNEKEVSDADRIVDAVSKVEKAVAPRKQKTED